MNADQATAVVQVLTGTIEGEGAATRKVLSAVPNGNRDYKPDPKSRSAWDIAVHLAMSDVWFADSILAGKFEWTGERLAKLRAMSSDNMLRNVEFFGMNGPACTWLAMMNNHSIHHRGQLAAYLRAAGSKVPAIYGMSADENAFG